MIVKNDEFRIRIKTLRKKLKFTLADLSKRTNLKPQYLCRLENKVFTRLPYINVKKIADALNTTPQYLMEGCEFKTFVKFDKVNKLIPLLNWDEVNDWLINGVKMLTERNIEYVNVEENKPENCFLLKIINDSMETNDRLSFNQGENIIVDPTLNPENGKFIVCEYKNNGIPILRQFFNDGNKKILKPLNERYPIEIINEEENDQLIIYGVVIEKRIIL